METYYVINIQNPEAQSIFRYHDELDAIVAYYNALSANYSAFKAGTLEHFTVCIMDGTLNVKNGYIEVR